jgi:hypothetical protein
LAAVNAFWRNPERAAADWDDPSEIVNLARRAALLLALNDLKLV